MEPKHPLALKDRKRKGKPIVLVVDDDKTHHKLLQLLADRLEIAVHCTPSCSKAIGALELFSFDLVLMDYRMPEIDGCACTNHIRLMKQNRSVPIIAVTGDIIPDTRTKCLAAGMDDFLAKPFTLEELTEKLCYWLNKKLA